MKGIAYGGAISALTDAGVMKHVKVFKGSSAGSQTAALLAAGYTGKELVDALGKVDIAELLTEPGKDESMLGFVLNQTLGKALDHSYILPLVKVISLKYIRDVVKLVGRFVFEFGVYDGQKLEAKIDELLEKKFNKTRVTFKDIFDKTQHNLSITGTCVSTQRLEIFSNLKTPNMPVARYYTNVHVSFYLPTSI